MWIGLPWIGVLVIAVLVGLWLALTRSGRLALAATRIGIASLPQRWGASSVIVVGIAGVVGVLVPILPGTLLVAGSVVVWAAVVGTGEAWTWAGVALAVLALGTVVKYAVPHRRIRDAGVPNRTLLAGAVLGVVGFFVVPVLGLFLGFVLGMYVAERRRVGAQAAGPSTRAALAAVGVSILIELASGVLAALTWVVGVVLT